jgi:alkylation response protein AidB-like acyl-CoA dehydrogenase
LKEGRNSLGTRSIPHGDAIIRDVRVPKDNLIIGPGEFARLMTAFNMERLHNCAVSLGGMMGAYDEVAAHVQKRIVFGRPVIEFQAVYHALADISVDYRGASAAVAPCRRDGDRRGVSPQMQEVTMAKLFGGTQIPQVTMKCLEMMGGRGRDQGLRYRAPASRGSDQPGCREVPRRSCAIRLPRPCFPSVGFRRPAEVGAGAGSG